MSEESPYTEATPANARQTVGHGASPPIEHDLIAVVRSGTPEQRWALARRAPLPIPLAEALVEAGEAEIVAAVLKDCTAELSERLLLECLDRLADDESVQEALIRRDRLPASVAQRLLAVTRGRLSAELAARHALTPLPEGEPGELGTDRPQWWLRHLERSFR